MRLALLLCGIALVMGVGKAPPKGKWFDHVFIMQFENEDEPDVIRNSIFGEFAKDGAELANYYAVTHPSQPNYFAQTSGNTWISDDGHHDLKVKSVVDLLEGKGLSWKAYMEDYPGHCKPDMTIGKYYRKHNPFISYDDVRDNATRCAKIVPLTQLDKDLANDALPAYSYFSPNIDNDGHNTGIAFAGKFLNKFLSPLMNNTHFTNGNLVVITWDEDDGSHHNHIYTALLGPATKAGTIDNTHYTHYSLLHTIEENWNLGNLGNHDKTANSFTCLLTREEQSRLGRT